MTRRGPRIPRNMKAKCCPDCGDEINQVRVRCPPCKRKNDNRNAPYRVLSLFAGIGGFDRGLERTGGFKTVAFCEIEDYPRRVLKKHWPDVPCYEDVRTLTADKLAGVRPNFITAGFPCQNVSVAGGGQGLDGQSSGLVRHVVRLVDELRPVGVILENSAALRRRGLEQLLGWFAGIGYDAEWYTISAASVGAPHERARMWIVAYPEGKQRWPGLREKIKEQHGHFSADCTWWDAEPNFPRVDAGISYGPQRRRAIGNSVVTFIPEIIGRAILKAERAIA